MDRRKRNRAARLRARRRVKRPPRIQSPFSDELVFWAARAIENVMAGMPLLKALGVIRG
jgi:hypothetical protein